MGQIEDCINFITRVDSRAIPSGSSATLLNDYVLKTLLLDPMHWEEASTPHLRHHVSLCHLQVSEDGCPPFIGFACYLFTFHVCALITARVQSVYLTLEEMMFGSPLDNVALKYKEELSDNLASQLAKHRSKIDAAVLVPVLHDFLIDQLTTVGSPMPCLGMISFLPLCL